MMNVNRNSHQTNRQEPPLALSGNTGKQRGTPNLTSHRHLPIATRKCVISCQQASAFLRALRRDRSRALSFIASTPRLFLHSPQMVRPEC